MANMMGARYLAGLILLSCLAQGTSAETPEKPKTFGFLSIVPSPDPVFLNIGPTRIGEEGWNMGLYTGVLTWAPPAPLKAELKGYKPCSLPVPKDLKPGECPTLILLDATESPSPEKTPEPNLKWISIENASDRPKYFFDALDLTTGKELEIEINGKLIQLQKNKRQRISTDRSLHFMVPNGPEGSFSPSEDGLQILLIFYSSMDGHVACTSVKDVLGVP